MKALRYLVFVHADQECGMTFYGKATGQMTIQDARGGMLWSFEHEHDMLALLNELRAETP